MVFLSSALRLAAAAVSSTAVPDVLVTFGTRLNRITFVSHPGVMAVARLLEMRYLTRPRAVMTYENVEAINEFDPELARKAKIAVDNNLAINFMELEHIDKPEFLEKLIKEKEILDKIRQEVLSIPSGGEYSISPDLLKSYELPEIPRAYRPELEITQDVLDVQTGLREDLELQKVVNAYVRDGVQKEKLLAFSDGSTKKLPQSKGKGKNKSTE